VRVDVTVAEVGEVGSARLRGTGEVTGEPVVPEERDDVNAGGTSMSPCLSLMSR